jgi:formate dehydrogenase major subunit
MQRFGLANLDWLVVRDLVMIESATFWKNGPEIETGEMRAEDINTEVFFMPAAAHTEKDGSFTNTQGMLQWHHTAVEPAGDARSDLWFMYHLGRRIRQKLAAAAGETVLGQSARERVVRGRFHRPHRGGPAARRGLSGSVIRLPPGAGNTVG